MFRRLCKILKALRLRGLYVIADGSDNSVTLSRRLYRLLGVEKLERAKVFVFRVSSDGSYGFTLNPAFADSTQVSDIMYNSKYRCIGFESLCPTVNRILYDYGLPSGHKYKFTVEPVRAGAFTYYKILKGHD